ncbi:MAG: ParA family partition ATPase [Pseudomonadota bacterium]|nr:ParA family partition ATPase [Pseudomonadota bacterium]
MSAAIIAITNQKGGSGKTTVAMTLAGTLGRRGFRVLVVDADAQGTAIQWAIAAPDETPFPATVSGLAGAGSKIHREIDKQVDLFDVIIVDCPPAVDAITPQSALLVADLALVPVIPSPADLWAAVGTRTLIDRIEGINEDLTARILANACQPRARITRAVMDRLIDFGIPLLSARMNNRTAYRQAMALGMPVQDLGTEARLAMIEVEAVADEVLLILEARNMEDSADVVQA